MIAKGDEEEERKGSRRFFPFSFGCWSEERPKVYFGIAGKRRKQFYPFLCMCSFRPHRNWRFVTVEAFWKANESFEPTFALSVTNWESADRRITTTYTAVNPTSLNRMERQGKRNMAMKKEGRRGGWKEGRNKKNESWEKRERKDSIVLEKKAAGQKLPFHVKSSKKPWWMWDFMDTEPFFLQVCKIFAISFRSLLENRNRNAFRDDITW